MANHAIVIGIDDYAEPKWNLTGAVKDALRFHKWATTAGGVTNVRLLLSTSGAAAKALATGEATSESITQTIVDYQEGAGRDGDRLYFFYAGHGLSAPGVQKGGRVEPVIVPSDVKSLKIHSNRLISFSEIMPALAGQAPWEQIFFIDACRDFGLEDHQSPIGGVGPWFPPNTGDKKRASQYLLYAASPGQRAAETSVGIFTSELLDALTGKEGMEMTYSQVTKTYQIYLPKLAMYVRKRVEETAHRKFLQNANQYIQVPQYQTMAEGADPIIVSLPVAEVRKYPLRIRVSPAEALVACRVAAGIYLPGLDEPTVYAQDGPPAPLPVRFELLPQDYSVYAVADGYVPARATCDLYGPREVDLQLLPALFLMPIEDVFRVTRDGVHVDGNDTGGGDEGVELAIEPETSIAAPAATRIIVRSEDAMAEVVLRDQAGNEVRRATGEIDEVLAPGMYRAQLLIGGTVRGEELVQAVPGERNVHVLSAPELQFGSAQSALLHDLDLLKPGSQYLYPSRDRALADVRLASLLAFAAYAKLGGGNTPELERLNALQIAVPSSAPAILAIVGASGDAPFKGMRPETFVEETSLIVFDADENVVSRNPYQPIPDFPVAAQQVVAMQPGSATVRCSLPGRTPTHYALACLEGRVTVFIVVANDDGTIETQQYLLPAPGVPHDDETGLSSENLRRVDVAQRTYRKTANISLEHLGFLLDGKWTDPLLGCLAGYTLLRRGDRTRFEHAAENMVAYFPELPDSHVLAALQWPEKEDVHFAEAQRRGTPVFAEGFTALQKWREKRHVEIGPELDDIVEGLLPSTPWTAWVLNRPALPMREDGIIAPPIAGWASVEKEFATVAEIARSVGQIGTADGQPSGTGFVIAPGVVVTPRFVVERKDVTTLRVSFAPRADGAAPSFTVDEIVYPQELPQFAYLRIRGDVPPPPPLTISAQLPPAHAKVYIVSYPVQDQRFLNRDLHRYDGGKRISPGRVLGVVGDDGILNHDCATALGSAGGAIIALATHHVLGVHQSARLQDNLKIGSGIAITRTP